MGVRVGHLVGVTAKHGLDVIVALLGTLKAGAGYVPLPDYFPADRLRSTAMQSGLGIVIGHIPALTGLGLSEIAMENLADQRPEGRFVPDAALTGASVAYVMYTSGSTGTPKGVVIPHRGILRLVGAQDYMTLGPDSRILQNSPVAFDAATLEIWGALLNGGTLVIADDDALSLSALGRTLHDQRITTLWLTAGLFHAMADETPEAFAPLTHLLTGGDVVSPARVARVMAACPDLAVINGYGPTENTTFTCCHPITRAEADSGAPLPIGRPIRGTGIHVLNDALHPVPVGEVGELYASGRGLALGYLGRDDLTAEKFISAPWDPALMLYRTGDLVRQNAAGLVHFVGRLDGQVKIRGFRIELGEIETALESHPGVKRAVAVATTLGGQDDKVLAAYLLFRTIPVPRQALVDHIKTRLPDHARPAYLIGVGDIPVTANGKVDLRALPPPTVADMLASEAAPQTETERHLADIWAEALGFGKTGSGKIGLDADFFEMGGHSLLAVKVFARIKRKFGVDLPISTLFAHPTLRTLAHKIRDTVDTSVNRSVGQAYSGRPENAPWDTSVIVDAGPGTGARPLFVVGGGGGNVNNLVDLGRILGKHRAVIGLQTRGILGHSLHTSIETTAADHLANIRRYQPQGPYLLAGYSAGAFTAFEMARQLRAGGEEVGFVGLLDTSAPHFTFQKVGSWFDRLRYSAGLVRKYGPKPLWLNVTAWASNKLQPDALVRAGMALRPEKFRHLALERHWWTISAQYDPAPYAGDAWLFLTESDLDGFIVNRMRKVDPLFGWSAFVQGDLRVSKHVSSHLSMLTGTAVVDLANMIEAEIKHAEKRR